KVFAVADSPHWQQLHKRIASIGMVVGMSFNVDFDRLLPQTSGHWLVLTAVGDRFPLPPKLRQQYSPLSTAQLQDMLRKHPSGRADRVLADGTRVVLLYARSSSEMAAEIEHLTLDEKSPVSPSVNPL